jgi:peptidyl-prolyl cis-trans isomerase D
MLQRIRDSLQAQKWLAMVILGALALVFAAWGAYGIVDLGIGSGTYAAKVEGEKVSIKDAQEAWQQQQMQWQQRMGGELPADLKERLQDQLLEGMVREALIGKHSHDLGYRVSDQQLHDQIRQIPAFQIDGQYNAAQAKYALDRVGMSPAMFEASLRRDLQRGQIENGLRISDFVTPTELKRLQALQSEQREVRYATVPADKYAAEAKIDDAAIEAYYKKNQAQYMTPEYVQLAYAELRLEQVASQVTVSDDEISDYYNKNKDKYVQPEKRRSHHILIESGKDDAAALKKAQDVLAQAKSGKDFGELAKKYSQDPGSAEKGGELDWAERSYFDAAFADALFSMQPGEIRGPVKTQYGYHIIRLDEIQPSKGQSLAEARPEIEAELRKDKAADLFGNAQEQIQQRLEQPGADLNTLAKDLNLQTGEVAQFERGKGGAPLGDSQELEDAVFSTAVLDEHKIGGPIALGEDRLVIVKALNHKKPEPKPLATVRDEIVAALRKEHGTQAAAAAAEAARAKLNAGTSFDDVVKELGVTADAAHFVGREDPSVPAPVREAVFKAPKPADGKPVNRAVSLENGNAAVVSVSAVRIEPNPSPDDLEREKRQVIQRHAQGDAIAYLDELRRTADVSKNPKAFE